MMGEKPITQKVFEAALRVHAIFSSGCDRAEAADLYSLSDAGLMTTRRCTKADAEMMDSMEPGETLFEFNKLGLALIDAQFPAPQKE